MKQIQTNEIPLQTLNFISYTDFIELVVNKGIRPERPDADEAPQMTDVLWQLAERCWATKATERPNADVVCDAISHELRNTNIAPKEKAIDRPMPGAPPTTNPATASVDHNTILGPSGNLETTNHERGVQDVKEKVCGIPC